MSSFNKIILLGRVGKDPELQTTKTGKQYCRFSVATQAKKDSPTQWHTCVVWEKSAEVFSQYVKKGHRVLLEGEVKYEEYEKDGNRLKSTSVVVHKFVFIEGAESSKTDVKTQADDPFGGSGGVFPF